MPKGPNAIARMNAAVKALTGLGAPAERIRVTIDRTGEIVVDVKPDSEPVSELPAGEAKDL